MLPHRTAENTHPIVWLMSIYRISPHIIVPIFTISPTTLHKPRMLIGGVVEYGVQNHAQPFFVGAAQQSLKIFQRAELLHNAIVVLDIIPVVEHRGVENGTQPENIHTEFF